MTTHSPRFLAPLRAICAAAGLGLLMIGGAQAQPLPATPEATCFKPDIAVTCGRDGAVDIAIKPAGAGTGAPDSVQITPVTPGIAVTPANFTPIGSGAPGKITVTGASPGSTIKLLVEGSRTGGGSFAGADLCCSQTIDVKIPENVCVKPPKFAIAKTCEPAAAGEDVKCRITVSSTDKTSVFPGTFSFTEALSQGSGGAVQIVSTTSPQPWACTPATPTAGPLSCSISGAVLAANQNTSSVDVTIKVPADAKDVKNCAGLPKDAAAGAQYEKVCTDIVITDPPQAPDLSLKKSFTKGASANAGSFSLDVKNEGGALAVPNVIKITDSVPAGVTITGYGGTSAADWNCSGTFPVVGPASLVCTYKGAMPVAAGAMLPSLTLSATLASAGAGSSEVGIYSNCATTGLSKNGVAVTESNTANNKACAVTNVINTAGCELGTANCPRPQASCTQDVLFIVDASVSINSPGQVSAGIKKFLQPMIGKGGKTNIFTFNNKANWTNTTGGWVPITGGVNTAITLGGTRTNWDDALQRGYNEVVAHSPKPLVVFITDGEPTAYNDAGGTEKDASLPTPQPVTAATEATHWINQIRSAGSPLIAVGFGAAGNAGYLDAAFSGPSSTSGSVDLQNASVIKGADETALVSILGQLGNQACGTLSLNKSGGGDKYHTITAGQSLAVDDAFTFTLTLTNNAATPVTGIMVQDQLLALLTNPTVLSSTPGTTGTFAGQTLSWSVPTLGALQTATLTFKAQFKKTYSAATVDAYNNYAQLTAAANYTATTPNSMNPASGPVVEVDESSIGFREIIYVSQPSLCSAANPPAYCFGSASKARTAPGAETGECTSPAAGQSVPDCRFSISIGLSSPPIPAGSTVQVKDDLTLNGTPVTWPATVPASICSGPLPTTASFTCPHTGLSSFSGTVGIKIPSGQTGALKNCITVTVSNPSAGSPFPLTFSSCATVTLTAPTAKVSTTDYSSVATAVGIGSVLIPTLITTGKPDPVACPPGTVRNARGECIRSRVQCGPGLVPNAAGLCVASDDRACPPGTIRLPGAIQCTPVQTACPAGQVKDPATGRCVTVTTEACPPGMIRPPGMPHCVLREGERCPPGMVRDPVTGRCQPIGKDCRPPQIRQNGACVDPRPACDPPRILRNGECVLPPPKCEPPMVLRRGECVDPRPKCDLPKIMRNGHCVLPPPKCEPPMVPRRGECVDPRPKCAPPMVLQRGRCVEPLPKCGPGQVLKGRTCVELVPRCRPPMVMQEGRCVQPRPTCTPPAVFVPPLGRCAVPPGRGEPKADRPVPRPAVQRPLLPGTGLPGLR